MRSAGTPRFRSGGAVVGLLLVVAFPCLGARRASAEEIHVAVASNFLAAAREVADIFESDTGHRVILISGSTGKHYAQIVHGAALDVFLAADRQRPELLEAEGLAVPGTRFTYARGCLVLWSSREDLAGRELAGRELAGRERVGEGMAVLEEGDFRHLAIAEPRLAPYGRAAREVLEGEGLWESVQPRLVRGENIAQTFQFVASGNAELGFVACSQVLGPVAPGGSYWGGTYWRVPDELHSAIEQQAVLLRDAAAPRELLAFLRSEAGRAVVERHGYVAP